MELGNKDVVTTARLLAYEMHKGISFQRENGDVWPQTIHLQEVADLVWASGGTDEEIAAAWLHDSLEDTPLTHEELEKHCGADVAATVHGLTDFDEWVNLPMLERKTLQSNRIKGESVSVKRVKICDQISNVRGLATSHPLDMTTNFEKPWTLEMCQGYVEGARLIVEGCKGVSPMLDNLFQTVYEKAVAKYGKVA